MKPDKPDKKKAQTIIKLKPIEYMKILGKKKIFESDLQLHVSLNLLIQT